MINGVQDYVTMTVAINFEPGKVCCRYCPLLETYSRNQCRRTGEYIVDPNVTVGRWCPLEEKHEKMPEV